MTNYILTSTVHSAVSPARVHCGSGNRVATSPNGHCSTPAVLSTLENKQHLVVLLIICFNFINCMDHNNGSHLLFFWCHCEYMFLLASFPFLLELKQLHPDQQKTENIWEGFFLLSINPDNADNNKTNGCKNNVLYQIFSF